MRHNPVLMKNRPQYYEEKTGPGLPWYIWVIMIISMTVLLTGCQIPPCKDRIVIQVVKVPVPTECPKPSIPERTKLPSTLVPAEEVNRDLKGSILNQAYLIQRIVELENLLKTYVNQPTLTKETK